MRSRAGLFNLDFRTCKLEVLKFNYKLKVIVIKCMVSFYMHFITLYSVVIYDHIGCIELSIGTQKVCQNKMLFDVTLINMKVSCPLLNPTSSHNTVP